MIEKYYWSPVKTRLKLYADMLNVPHLLIGGTTGSGKSVLINQLITTGIAYTPAHKQFILIDPKRVELYKYAHLPHCMYYADTPERIENALTESIRVMEERFERMRAQGLTMSDQSDIYIIIDELADMMTTRPRTYGPLIQRLAQLGRAARMHVIAATQCPLREVIPTPIKVNFDNRICLRTRNAQDSRNIMGESGGEKLPPYGECYWAGPMGTKRTILPLYKPEAVEQIMDFWTKHPKPMPRDRVELWQRTIKPIYAA